MSKTAYPWTKPDFIPIASLNKETSILSNVIYRKLMLVQSANK